MVLAYLRRLFGIAKSSCVAHKRTSEGLMIFGSAHKSADGLSSATVVTQLASQLSGDGGAFTAGPEISEWVVTCQPRKIRRRPTVGPKITETWEANHGLKSDYPYRRH